MQTHTLSSLCMIMAGVIIMVSCKKTEKIAENVLNRNHVSPTSVSILSFDSEADFLAVVQAIRDGEEFSSPLTKSSGTAEFKSLFDEYNQAMNEADDYYQREGGYEEFKAKYPNLYFPEYGEDYAAFLPVSDEAVAKLLNLDGKVRIAGTDVDYRDVDSYERIVELGLGMPEYEYLANPETKAFSDIVTLTEDRQTVNAKRKAWITRRGIKFHEASAKIGRVDLCFRKKGFLGWYNGKMISRSYSMTRSFSGAFRKEYHPFYFNDNSPHRYVAAFRPIEATTSNFGVKTLFFECGEDEPEYSFTGSFTLNLDALLDLNNGPGFWESISFTVPLVKYKF